MKNFLNHCSLIVFLAFPLATLANSDDPFQEKDAHTHSEAELQIVLEGSILEILLHSPAMNLTGFEHLAKTAAEQAKVAEVKKLLADTNAILEIPKGDCKQVSQHIDIGSLLPSSPVEQEASPAADQSHEHHNHDHDHQDNHSSNNHSNIEAHYHYQCSQAQRIDSANVKLLSSFSGIETLQVQWIIQGRQGTTRLTRNKQTIHFR